MQATLAPAKGDAAPLKKKHSRFYIAMGVLALFVVVAGFWPAFVRVVTGGSTPPIILIHTFVFGCWIALFIFQSVLVAKGNIATHRRMGVAAAILAILMLVVGYLTAIAGARRGFDLNGKNDPLAYAVFPLGDLVSFAVLVGVGIYYRNRPQAHKRLLLLATIGALMNAPLAHLIAHTPALQWKGPPAILPMMLVLYFASAVYDKLKFGRIHPVSLWVAIALFVWGNFRAVVVYPSKPWHDFAAWLIQ
ncbi:MAG TPA: hypothetical protein VM680_13680 [Verrucomicrobiae bacterium]|nr:hypothetical protein [Verrucomicrobiae bacterium]